MSKTSTLIFNSTSNFAKYFMNIPYKFDGRWSTIELFRIFSLNYFIVAPPPPPHIKFTSNSIAGQNIFLNISIVGHPPTLFNTGAVVLAYISGSGQTGLQICGKMYHW